MLKIMIGNKATGEIFETTLKNYKCALNSLKSSSLNYENVVINAKNKKLLIEVTKNGLYEDKQIKAWLKVENDINNNNCYSTRKTSWNSNYNNMKKNRLKNYYRDTTKAYKNEIAVINNMLSSGFYIGKQYEALNNRKTKLVKKCNPRKFGNANKCLF